MAAALPGDDEAKDRVAQVDGGQRHHQCFDLQVGFDEIDARRVSEQFDEVCHPSRGDGDALTLDPSPRGTIFEHD